MILVRSWSQLLFRLVTSSNLEYLLLFWFHCTQRVPSPDLSRIFMYMIRNTSQGLYERIVWRLTVCLVFSIYLLFNSLFCNEGTYIVISILDNIRKLLKIIFKIINLKLLLKLTKSVTIFIYQQFLVKCKSTLLEVLWIDACPSARTYACNRFFSESANYFFQKFCIAIEF